MAERLRGHIKRFSHQRRSGLIRPDDGYPDIWGFLSDFRSVTDASRVTPGDAVEFRVEHAPEGPMAVDVVVLRNGATTERVKGHIKWFNHQRRYGFIQRDDGLQDVFVHMNGFHSAADAHWVRDGGAVEFEVEWGPKGKGCGCRRVVSRGELARYVNEGAFIFENQAAFGVSVT